MSVLIEALTMVVPRRVLDVSYPGGPGAFLQALAGLERPPRFVCDGDPEVVAASFHDRRPLEPAYDLLEEYLICSDGKEFVELALVREGQGPPMPCGWLEWKNHEDGFTFAWHAGGEPGMLAPPGRAGAPPWGWGAGGGGAPGSPRSRGPWWPGGRGGGDPPQTPASRPQPS